jgi:catechol 2,3-dioxygenase-like lactoylglutathione lyase family enzyme
MGLLHITLPTKDVGRTVRFFEETLGWQRIHRAGNIEAKAAWLEIAPGQEAHLLEIPEFEPTPFEREYGRHVAVSAPLTSFPDLKQRLTLHGAELIDPKRATPFERFFFRDPNGYIFEVVEETARPERQVE